MALAVTMEERFRGLLSPEPNSGCWLWDGPWNHKGYGHLCYGNRTVRAHRYSWELVHGPIPDGALVCHRCDTPACVNPEHLFLGTAKQNTADMVRKGRMVRPNLDGEASPHAKLTEQDVRAIRQDSRPLSRIASAYGVSKQAVSNIKLRKSWGHL